jgi:hypothetical protein
MVKEAIEQLGGRATNAQIADYINSKWQNVNKGTIMAQITVCTVNNPSRVHFPENSKVRKANGRYDFLYKIGRGEVVQYDPTKHGNWSIERKDGRFVVIQDNLVEPGEIEEPAIESEQEVQSFALESHLRDFLTRHLDIVEKGMTLFRDEHGRDGIEYPTQTGPIDILAKDVGGNFVVFELKVSRGSDKVVGQLQRYAGWVRKHLSNNRPVRGVIIAQILDEGLKYAASENPNLKIFEYELQFKINPVSI